MCSKATMASCPVIKRWRLLCLSFCLVLGIWEMLYKELYDWVKELV